MVFTSYLFPFFLLEECLSKLEYLSIVESPELGISLNIIF